MPLGDQPLSDDPNIDHKEVRALRQIILGDRKVVASLRTPIWLATPQHFESESIQRPHQVSIQLSCFSTFSFLLGNSDYYTFNKLNPYSSMYLY